MSIKYKSIQYVPMEFQVHHPFRYPQHSKIDFERWFRDNTRSEEITGDRHYLPIMWTAYWCTHKYGKDGDAVNKLKLFVNALDKSKKYFTICQYDDGPMVDFKGHDVIVCGMSGGRIDYPIPLLCEEHEYRFAKQKRNLLACFNGANTHPIRENLVRQFKKRMDCQVSLTKIKSIDFCALMNRSIFALCPRGYGKTSFRIQEAIQYGAIPVYISDDFVFPYNEGFEYGIVINTVLQPDIFNNTYDYLHSISQNKEMIESIQNKIHYSNGLFTYQGCKTKILNYINTH